MKAWQLERNMDSYESHRNLEYLMAFSVFHAFELKTPFKIEDNVLKVSTVVMILLFSEIRCAAGRTVAMLYLTFDSNPNESSKHVRSLHS